MKHATHLTLLLFTLSMTSWTAEPSPDTKASVVNAEAEWKAAVLKGDHPELDRLLATDLSYTHSSSKTQTKAEFIQDVTGGTTVYKVIDFENTKLRQYGTVVVITQSAVITTVQTGTAHLYLTEVWAKEGAQWQMVSRQATKLP